ncbi:MAG TPA: type IV pilus assembly protein PilM [Gemmatimonadaceae bacterium]|jgi:type IV pilus assembly protein PilM|nr:type IV pilus assembly protein PilM [Gemmatimonadaceae bacterium]
MALFSRNKTTVGLDIGSGLIKVAVIDHGKGAPELVKIAIAPLPADAIVEGEVMDPALVADAIRAALQDAEVTTTDVVTAVGGRDVIIKRIQTERVKEQQARELMRWEAEQHVPDVESVELDFQVLDPDGAAGEEMSVLLVAAKRDLVDAKVRILTEAGLKASIVDVDAFALHNAFEVSYPHAMLGSVVLVNIGNEITNVNVLDDGIPILTRDLVIGTRRIREDLQRSHGLSAEEAEAMIRGFDRTPQLDAVLEIRGEEIGVGVERAAAFLVAAAKRAAQVQSVYICGGGSRTPGLAEVIARRLNLPVEQANPLANLHVRDGAMDAFATDEVAPLLMLPVGLALRQA